MSLLIWWSIGLQSSILTQELALIDIRLNWLRTGLTEAGMVSRIGRNRKIFIQNLEFCTIFFFEPQSWLTDNIWDANMHLCISKYDFHTNNDARNSILFIYLLWLWVLVAHKVFAFRINAVNATYPRLCIAYAGRVRLHHPKSNWVQWKNGSFQFSSSRVAMHGCWIYLPDCPTQNSLKRSFSLELRGLKKTVASFSSNAYFFLIYFCERFDELAWVCFWVVVGQIV